MTSATGKTVRLLGAARRRRAPGFTLIELLSVVAIMAIVMGSLGIAISNMGGSSVQVAAAQVASGLSLARQYAVSKNAETRFVICNAKDSSGDGLPQESWRHWTVIQTNRNQGTWTMMKEWEKLPSGVVFLNLASGDYSVINGDPMQGVDIGTPFVPEFKDNFGNGSEWKGFASTTNGLSVVVAGSTKSFKLGVTPCIGFRGIGEAVKADGRSLGTAGGNVQELAIRLASGAVTSEHQIILKSDKNYFYVETDKRGRVRVRSPETYRN